MKYLKRKEKLLKDFSNHVNNIIIKTKVRHISYDNTAKLIYAFVYTTYKQSSASFV